MGKLGLVWWFECLRDIHLLCKCVEYKRQGQQMRILAGYGVFGGDLQPPVPERRYCTDCLAAAIIMILYVFKTRPADHNPSIDTAQGNRPASAAYCKRDEPPRSLKATQ